MDFRKAAEISQSSEAKVQKPKLGNKSSKTKVPKSESVSQES